MIDRSFIGMRFDPITVDVEKGQLRFFAEAVGETNPIYSDEAAAKAAGYSALPAPPTFSFALNMMRPNQYGYLDTLGADLGKLLHGEQHFEYYAPIYAGDRITLEGEITDIYAKKGGALEFIVQQTTATNQHGEKVVRMTSTLVLRN